VKFLLKKRFFIPICIAIILAIAAPTYLLANANKNGELQAIQTSFIATYGTGKTWVETPIKQSDIYTIYWKDNEKIHVSALIGGIWIELASQPLETPTTTPTPAQ
jgi:hypothetical protein